MRAANREKNKVHKVCVRPTRVATNPYSTRVAAAAAAVLNKPRQKRAGKTLQPFSANLATASDFKTSFQHVIARRDLVRLRLA